VGIPFLDAGESLEEAVRSVFAQTRSDWRLILVDDGSTDGSLERVRRIDDARVRVLSDGENRGLPSRLNQIAGLAETPWLARMDADDVMHPDRLAAQVRFLEEENRTDVVASGVYGIDRRGRVLSVRESGPLDTDPARVLFGPGLVVHPTVTGRTEWFRAHPYDEFRQRTEDRELWCRTCVEGRFRRLARPLLFYREDSGGDRWAFARKYWRTVGELRSLYRSYGPALVGRTATELRVAGLYGKALIHTLAAALSLQDKLLARRGRRPGEEERRVVEGILQEIRQTEVPGWDS
jgi:glycosyltransferase involved in cell wall biosynthesis